MNQTPASGFAPTRWTLVLRSRGETPEARLALGELCEAYYEPILQFLRRERGTDAAPDLAQEFFRKILAHGGFENAAPERGRFRSYLLGALKHFLADQRKREHRLKRGAGQASASLDTEEELSGTDPAPDALFDREWALALLARAARNLEAEFSDSEKRRFEVLKPWLLSETPGLSQADAARALNLSEGAVKVAIHRLRKRFRGTIRSEISQTLRDSASVDEELRYLIEALSDR